MICAIQDAGFNCTPHTNSLMSWPGTPTHGHYKVLGVYWGDAPHKLTQKWLGAWCQALLPQPWRETCLGHPIRAGIQANFTLCRQVN